MRLELQSLPDLPRIEPGDDLAALLLAGLEGAGAGLEDGDVLVVAQKIVSKAEGRYVDLADVTPSKRAIELAEQVDKDPRLVEVILRESTEVVRHKPGVLVVAHRLGLVLANAGVDQSNIEHREEGDRVLLLPENPDRSAEELRRRVEERTAKRVGVVISDSLGRAWRLGTVGIAIGAAGIPCLVGLRGRPDLFGRPLRVSEEAVADELAAAASLLQGQGAEGRPAVLIRGFSAPAPSQPARHLVRPREEDLFR